MNAHPAAVSQGCDACEESDACDFCADRRATKGDRFQLCDFHAQEREQAAA